MLRSDPAGLPVAQTSDERGMSSRRTPGTLRRIAWSDCHFHISESDLIRITTLEQKRKFTTANLTTPFANRSGCTVASRQQMIAPSQAESALHDFEHGDRLAQAIGLFRHGLRRGSGLLDQRCVLLRDFVHLADGNIDLLDSGALLVRC